MVWTFSGYEVSWFNAQYNASAEIFEKLVGRSTLFGKVGEDPCCTSDIEWWTRVMYYRLELTHAYLARVRMVAGHAENPGRGCLFVEKNCWPFISSKNHYIQRQSCTFNGWLGYACKIACYVAGKWGSVCLVSGNSALCLCAVVCDEHTADQYERAELPDYDPTCVST